MKAMKQVARKPHKAAKIVAKVIDIEERVIRRERELHSPNNDDDAEEVEDEANVSAVVRLMTGRV